MRTQLREEAGPGEIVVLRNVFQGRCLSLFTPVTSSILAPRLGWSEKTFTSCNSTRSGQAPLRTDRVTLIEIVVSTEVTWQRTLQ